MLGHQFESNARLRRANEAQLLLAWALATEWARGCVLLHACVAYQGNHRAVAVVELVVSVSRKKYALTTNNAVHPAERSFPSYG